MRERERVFHLLRLAEHPEDIRETLERLANAQRRSQLQINAVTMKMKSQFAVAVTVAVNAVRKSEKSKTIARN